jgi:hypothetical protein
MKQRLQKLLFEISYVIPVIMLNIMTWTKFAKTDSEVMYLLLLGLPLSICLGISIANLVRSIIDFKIFLKKRKEGRITGLDICPKCKGEGWIDWVEQITGKKEVRSSNDQIFP